MEPRSRHNNSNQQYTKCNRGLSQDAAPKFEYPPDFFDRMQKIFRGWQHLCVSGMDLWPIPRYTYPGVPRGVVDRVPLSIPPRMRRVFSLACLENPA